MKYLGLPDWAELLLQGILIFTGLASAAVVLTRSGRSPWLAFLIAVPYVQIIAPWALVYFLWREQKKGAKNG